MIFRRKKADGFDWHHYVRTTILFRRQQRRARVDEISRAAAGQAQAVAKAVGDVTAQGMAHVTNAGWRGSGAAWRAALALPAAAVIAAAGMAGAAALVWGLYRWFRVSHDLQALVTLGLASVLLALALLIGLRNRGAGQPPSTFRTAVIRVAALITPQMVQAMALATLALGLGWFAWGGGGPNYAGLTSGSLSSTGQDVGVLEGRAVALSGEMIRLQGRLLHLSGIEAPDRRQTCARANTKTWRCGEAALAALERMARTASFRCAMEGGPDAAGRVEASCTVDGRDVAGELVKAGNVFSAATYFGGYAAVESEARRAGNGVWSGAVERPAEFRAKLWNAAKSSAPDGCPIKGQIDGNRKTYLLPWSPRYETIAVRTFRGDRWFCDEASAQAAGFKPVWTPKAAQ